MTDIREAKEQLSTADTKINVFSGKTFREKIDKIDLEEIVAQIGSLVGSISTMDRAASHAMSMLRQQESDLKEGAAALDHVVGTGMVSHDHLAVACAGVVELKTTKDLQYGRLEAARQGLATFRNALAGLEEEADVFSQLVPPSTRFSCT